MVIEKASRENLFKSKTIKRLIAEYMKQKEELAFVKMTTMQSKASAGKPCRKRKENVMWSDRVNMTYRTSSVGWYYKSRVVS